MSNRVLDVPRNLEGRLEKNCSLTISLIIDILAREGPLSQEELKEKLRTICVKIRPRHPEFSPVYGTTIDTYDGNRRDFEDGLNSMQNLGLISSVTNGNEVSYGVTARGRLDLLNHKEKVKKELGYEVKPH